jgi:hypothetical protein
VAPQRRRPSASLPVLGDTSNGCSKACTGHDSGLIRQHSVECVQHKWDVDRWNDHIDIAGLTPTDDHRSRRPSERAVAAGGGPSVDKADREFEISWRVLSTPKRGPGRPPCSALADHEHPMSQCPRKRIKRPSQPAGNLSTFAAVDGFPVHAPCVRARWPKEAGWMPQEDVGHCVGPSGFGNPVTRHG